MASSTTNLDLTLPVGGENVSRQIINANNMKIDEAVGAVPSGTDLQSQVTALNSNLTVLDNDTVHLNDSASAGGAFTDGTNSWGISLTRKADNARYILRGRENGRIGIEKSTDGGTSWSLLYETVKTSEFGDAKARIYRLTGNMSSFEFEDLPDLTSERYKHFLLILGDATNANDLSVFIGGVGVNGASVSLKKIIGGNYTLTGSIANSKLTITSNATCYGGMRLIWLA